MPARGTSQFGGDVIVGSPEYWKLWREKNKDKHKLAQIKYRNKQRELMLAARLAVADGISVEDALAEVQGKAAALTEVRSELIREGRIDTAVSLNPVVVEVEPPIPEIAKIAKERGVPYAVVKAEWDADTSWGELEQLAKAKGILDDTEGT